MERIAHCERESRCLFGQLLVQLKPLPQESRRDCEASRCLLRCATLTLHNWLRKAHGRGARQATYCSAKERNPTPSTWSLAGASNSMMSLRTQTAAPRREQSSPTNTSERRACSPASPTSTRQWFPSPQNFSCYASVTSTSYWPNTQNWRLCCRARKKTQAQPTRRRKLARPQHASKTKQKSVGESRIV